MYFLREPDEMFEVVWGLKGPTGKEKKAIASSASGHRAELLTEWELKAEVKTPGAER